MTTKEWLMWGFHTRATDGRKMFVAIQAFPSTFTSSPFLLERLFLSRSRKKTSHEIKKKNLLEYSRENFVQSWTGTLRYLCLTKIWDYKLKVKQWRDKVKDYTNSNSAVYLWFVVFKINMVSHIAASMHQKHLLWPELLGLVSKVLSIYTIVNTDGVLGKFQVCLKCSMCIKSFNLHCNPTCYIYCLTLR